MLPQVPAKVRQLDDMRSGVCDRRRRQTAPRESVNNESAGIRLRPIKGHSQPSTLDLSIVLNVIQV
jgi:hypothetical protein